MRTFNENIIHTKQLLYGILFTLACSFIILSRNINALFSWNILSFVISCSFLMWFNGQFSRRSRWLRRGNAASCIISQTKDSYHTVETMQFMFMQQSCEGNMLIHSLLFPCMWTANSPADSADYAEGMQQAALFRRQKTATTQWRQCSSCLCNKAVRGTCSFIPCSSLACERPILPQIPLITQRECSKLHYFADKRQLPHSADNAVHVYVTKLWGEHARSFLVTSLALSLFIPRSSLTCERPILSQITQIIADKTQTTPKHHKHQPVFLCEIMQLAAFLLCVISVICGRITRKRTQAISTEETPIYLPQISLMTQTKPKNHNNYKMQFSAI